MRFNPSSFTQYLYGTLLLLWCSQQMTLHSAWSTTVSLPIPVAASEQNHMIELSPATTGSAKTKVAVLIGTSSNSASKKESPQPVKVISGSRPVKKAIPASFFNRHEALIKMDPEASTVPNKDSDAQAHSRKLNHEYFVLGSPLPDVTIDNGPAPVPQMITNLIASASGFSRRLLWPMRGGAVSSRFGMRWGRLHEGTDIAAPFGTPILAASDGVVIFTGWAGGYGKLVVVEHENGFKTKYGHCSEILVTTGQVVNQGETLAKVGSTGHSTGPHLHYEVISNSGPKDPEFFTHRR